jgi:hypothetical protein
MHIPSSLSLRSPWLDAVVSWDGSGRSGQLIEVACFWPRRDDFGKAFKRAFQYSRNEVVSTTKLLTNEPESDCR